MNGVASSFNQKEESKLLPGWLRGLMALTVSFALGWIGARALRTTLVEAVERDEAAARVYLEPASREDERLHHHTHHSAVNLRAAAGTSRAGNPVPVSLSREPSAPPDRKKSRTGPPENQGR